MVVHLMGGRRNFAGDSDAGDMIGTQYIHRRLCPFSQTPVKFILDTDTGKSSDVRSPAIYVESD
jgi:hypothetical protein